MAKKQNFKAIVNDHQKCDQKSQCSPTRHDLTDSKRLK